MSVPASPSPPDPQALIARLERRLAREQQARAEAEAIAEQETRALYENTRRLRLLETVARAANLGQSVEQVLGDALDEVCAFAGWPLGHVYLRDALDPEPRMASPGIWRARDGLDYGLFREASEQVVMIPGRGLPGRVLRNGQAVWIADLSQDDNFFRAPLAAACGLHAGFAFPVLVGAEVAAVLEFFSDRVSPEDKGLLHVMDQVGAVLGRAIERDWAHRRLEQTNTELQRAASEAQAASAAKTAFLAVTSHEIRTPLNAVLGLAEALSRASMPDEQRELVDGIRDSGGMLLRLLNAVLDVARVESGKVALAYAPFDLAQVAETVAKLWRARAEENAIRLDLDLTGLPRPCRIVSDAGKIEQTLANLVSNALKFTPSGGGILVRLSQGPDGVLAEVLDDGPGIVDGDRERIFKAYEQTPAGREAGGAGLGLAICAGNIRALGGEIAVETRAEGGSRFWFRFTAEAAPDEAAAQDDAPRPAAAETRALKVLAAEDNLANQRVLGLLLEPLGVAPIFVEDGEQAVRAAAAEAFDLILMDANMPRMDGVEAVRVIRTLQGPAADTPIFMVTANVFDDDRQRYMDAGADGVIAKPILVDELYAAVMAVGGAAA